MSVKCRLWWPKEISSTSKSSTLLLFGWFVSRSPTSLDIVVAFAYDEDFLCRRSDDSALQAAIQHAHGALPVKLQDKSTLTILGRCLLPSDNARHMCKPNMVDGGHKQPSEFAEGFLQDSHSNSLANSNNRNCGCLEYDGLLQQYRHACLHSASWIQLVHDAHNYSSNKICWVPLLHHLHLNGKMLSPAEVHVIVYETPRYGSHHFSVNFCSSKRTKCPSKRPKWVDELYQKPRPIDLETVIVAMNSSAAAKMAFERDLRLQRSRTQVLILYMLVKFVWRLFSAVVATFSTFLYISLQLFHKLAGCGSKFKISLAFANIFSNTWLIIQHRCHQILYWPIFLDERGLRSPGCVEYAEKSGHRRHSLWSSTIVDVILGNLFGFALLFHIEAVCRLTSTFAIHFTDDVLRTGCVWLMGVPAGFKLNTELAGVMGTISLNAIQIWSTLWFFASDILYHVIKVVALLGIVLGVTVSAALITDMIAVAAFHVYTLHQFVSFLYSLQIEALTALWRLFRGRKWNPLRQRLDSYEYSVEQHVVGSLLFTPLLLLLPTTSVFYIFFAIMNLEIIFLRILVQIIVSVIHDTPYTKILLWLVRSKRFPSGIWFEIMHCQSVSVAGPLAETGPRDKNMNAKKSVLLLSLLQSNILTFGQVISPHYKSKFSGAHGPNLTSAFSGILTGKSSLTKPHIKVPQKMPWMSISYKDYWCLCYYALLACMS